MVLAHELAHVFSLQLSRSRVPRWLTEGLAELETARLRGEWRRQADLELAAAFAAGKLPSLGDPVARLRQRARQPGGGPGLPARLGGGRVPRAALRLCPHPRGAGRLRPGGAGPGRAARRWPGMPEAELDAGPAPSTWASGWLPVAPVPARRAPPATASAAAGGGGGSPATPAGRGGPAQPGRGGPSGRPGRPRPRPGPGRGRATTRLVDFLAADLALESDEHRTGPARAAGAQAARACRATTSRSAWRWRPSGCATARRRWPTSGPPPSWRPAASRPRRMLAEQLRVLGKEDERLAVETEVLRLEPQTAALAKRVVLGHARAGRVGPRRPSWGGWPSSSTPTTPTCTPPWAGPWPRRTNPALPPARSSRRCCSAPPTRAPCTARWPTSTRSWATPARRRLTAASPRGEKP